MAASAPLVQLEAGGAAPVLRYDIPEPTAYDGKNLIELAFEEDVFNDAARQMPTFGGLNSLQGKPVDVVKAAVQGFLRTGVSAAPELPTVPRELLTRGLPLVEASSAVLGAARRPATGGEPEPQPPIDLENHLVDLITSGRRMVKGTLVNGEPTISILPLPVQPNPRLYLVESLRLTSFLGDYGAGRIVKTFTLLPGEVTRISVKSYRQRESTRKQASSVLDSLTSESAQDLETSVLREQADQRSYQTTKEYYADAEASASWGWGSASVKAGVKGSSNSAREESVKNVSNATAKHSARASAKREVEVNTSFEVTEKEGEETEVTRELENINLSRTLNFVFRQMNQEFVTLLHLVDVRIGFFNGDPRSRREVPISGLDGLLAAVVQPERREAVKGIVLEQLSAVRDRDGTPVDVVEKVTVTPGDVYLKFDDELTSTFTDARDRAYTVPGVLLKADQLVMRTEGVIVEALLGNGVALDPYAEALQGLEVDRRRAEVTADQARADQLALVNRVIGDGDQVKGAIAEKLVSRCCPRAAAKEPAPEPPASPAPAPRPRTDGDG